MGIALHIDFPQVLVQLRQGHLDGGLRGVDIHRGQLCSHHAPGHGELVGEHELRQLRQDAVLGPEDILENAVGHRRLVDNLRHGGFFVTLLQKQLDADRQDPFFGGQTGTCDGRNTHFLPYIWHACHDCNRDFRKRQGGFEKKPAPRTGRRGRVRTGPGCCPDTGPPGRGYGTPGGSDSAAGTPAAGRCPGCGPRS